MISGAFCALAGVLFVVYDQSANPDLLNWTESGYPILMAVLGGQGRETGPAKQSRRVTAIPGLSDVP